MSRSKTFITSMLLTLISSAISASPNQGPFSVTISMKQSAFRVGEPLLLRVTLKNVSQKEIKLAESPGAPAPAEYEYKIDVRDSEGKPAVPTKYYQIFMGPVRPSGSRVSVALQPGESSDDEATLNNLYDLSRPGKYVIQVSRMIPDHLGTGVVKSNTLKIDLTE